MQLAITSLTYLFATLITFDGILSSNYGDNEDALKSSLRFLKNLAIDSQDFFVYKL